MRQRFVPRRPSALFCVMLFFLSACEGIQIGADQMTQNLTPQQAEACRNAARQAVARQGISEDRIRRVHYQRVVNKSRGASNRITGFEAWVYPKEGRGALVIELTEACRVRRIWLQGTPEF